MTKNKGEYPTKKMLENMEKFSIASKMSSEVTKDFKGMKRNVKRIEFIKEWMRSEKEKQ